MHVSSNDKAKVPSEFDRVARAHDSKKSQAIWNAVTLGIVLRSARVLAGSAELCLSLRRSMLDFDGIASFEQRPRRAGFEALRTAPMTGWRRGMVQSLLARRPC